MVTGLQVAESVAAFCLRADTCIVFSMRRRSQTADWQTARTAINLDSDRCSSHARALVAALQLPKFRFFYPGTDPDLVSVVSRVAS